MTNIYQELPEKRYEYTLNKILDNQCLYLLEKEKHHYAVSQLDDDTLIALWPSEEFALRNADNNWINYQAIRLELTDVEPLLDSIEKKNWKLDVFPKGSKTGYVVSVQEFINDLNVMFNNE